MTREEIMEMSPEQLRLAVAEFMGWKPPEPELPLGEYKSRSAGGFLHLESGKIFPYRDVLGDSHWKRPDGKYYRLPPDYPNDPAAAMAVLDKLAEHHSVQFQKDGPPHPARDWWVIVGFSLKAVSVTAMTLEVAICRAALLVAEQDAMQPEEEKP